MILKYETQTKQAYWAGYLTAVLYNTYRHRKDLPSLILCMRDFAHLKTVFGKYYSLLKTNKNSHHAVEMYERFSNSISLADTMRGNFADFMIGFASKINQKKINHQYFEQLF